MTDLHFRAARLADLDAIVDLVTSAYRGDSSRAGWTTEADFLDGNRIDRVLVSEIPPEEPAVATSVAEAGQ